MCDWRSLVLSTHAEQGLCKTNEGRYLTVVDGIGLLRWRTCKQACLFLANAAQPVQSASSLIACWTRLPRCRPGSRFPDGTTSSHFSKTDSNRFRKVTCLRTDFFCLTET